MSTTAKHEQTTIKATDFADDGEASRVQRLLADDGRYYNLGEIEAILQARNDIYNTQWQRLAEMTAIAQEQGGYDGSGENPLVKPDCETTKKRSV